MLPPEEITQQTDALELSPRTLERRSPSERRQYILQQKQTEHLPALTMDTPNAKLARRQGMQLREENRHLRALLESQQVELRQLSDAYQTLQTVIEQEIAIIHKGYQQEVEHYQSHLQEMMEERNRLHDAYRELEQQYQSASHSYQENLETEARKMMRDAAQTVILSPERAPALLQDVVRTVELQVRQEEDKYMVEMLHLKRELQRMMTQLDQERQEVENERQQLFVWQHNLRQQAELRNKVIHARLHSRWKVAIISSSLGLLALLVILQFVCLSLFHVKISATISFSILTPILLCILLAVLFERPVTMLKHIYSSAPRKKKIR